MGVEKKVYSFRLDAEVIEVLKKISNEQHRSLSNLVETILIDYTKSRRKKYLVSEKK